MTGITVTLEVNTLTGYNALGEPVYESSPVNVSDVLVGEPSTDDITNMMTMYGKRIAYTMAIPKGDDHVWEDTYVTLPAPFQGRYHTIGIPTAGIDANIPLRWNKKVHIERIEGKSQIE